MLLAIFLILVVLWLLGLIGNFTFGGAIHLLLVIALVALVLSVVDVGGRGRAARVRLSANVGLVLAGIWFVLTGLFQLFAFKFQGESLVMALLALVAGVLMVLGR